MVFRTLELLCVLPLVAGTVACQRGLDESDGPAGQALTAEARLLAQPVSFELASSAHAEGIEDRATMAPLAARRVAEMISLGERIVTIELLVACQAVELRGHRLGAGTERACALVRERVPFKHEEDPILESLEPLRELVRSGELRPSVAASERYDQG